jgi:maltose alpha-D-glucosyltransferase/alpha-amylase
VNVADQLGDPDSALNWLRRAVAVRRQCPEVGVGTPSVLDTGDPRVFALRYTHHHELIVVHNVGSDEVAVDLKCDGGAYDIFTDGPYEPPQDGQAVVRRNGFRWLRLT